MTKDSPPFAISARNVPPSRTAVTARMSFREVIGTAQVAMWASGRITNALTRNKTGTFFGDKTGTAFPNSLSLRVLFERVGFGD